MAPNFRPVPLQPNLPLPGQMPGPMALPPGMGLPPDPAAQMAAMPPIPPGSVIAAALKLLRQGRLFDFRVEVSADTLIEPDLEAERDARNQFIQNTTQFLQSALPAVQSMPQITPLIQGLLMFGVRSFQSGRDLEGIIESSLQAVASAPPKEPPPDPKVEAIKAKTQSDMQIAQQKAQMEQQSQQAELQVMQQKAKAEIDAMLQKAQMEIQAMMQKAQAEIQIMREKGQADVQVKRETAQVQAQTALQDSAVNAQANQMSHEQALMHDHQQHVQRLQQEQVASEANAAHEQGEPRAERKGEGE
jgi:hypothetical protein